MNLSYLYFITEFKNKYVISKPLIINKTKPFSKFLSYKTNYEWDYKHEILEFNDIYDIKIYIIKTFHIQKKDEILKKLKIEKNIFTTSFSKEDIFMNNIFYKNEVIIDYDMIYQILINHLPFHIIDRIISYLSNDIKIYLKLNQYKNKLYLVYPKIDIAKYLIRFI